MNNGTAPITTTNAYNERLQPVTLSAGTAANTLFSRSFDFHRANGDNGNVYQVVNNLDNARNQTFTYDALNRIATAQSAATSGAKCWGESYTIDAWGNLTSRSTTKCSTVPLNAPATTKNQISGYCYDKAGNLLGTSACPSLPYTPMYTYDGENRLKTAGGVTYAYDGDNNRVRKSSGTLYWGTGPLSESDLSGNIQKSYVFFNGQRVARRDVSDGSVHYFYSDHLGSSSVITNATGTLPVEEDLDYFPYGGIAYGSSADHYMFTGKERDSESNLDNFGKRFYGSPLSRWTSPDLVNATDDRVVNPNSTLNKYVYGANNPLKYLDPDGRDITYFYDQGGIAGHAIVLAYDQNTGDSAVESFGPKYHMPVAPGVSMYGLDESHVNSADDLRDSLTSLTIQTSPEVTQEVINYIKIHPDPALWFVEGPNCSSQVWKILRKFQRQIGLKTSRFDGPGGLPRNVWDALIRQYNPSQRYIKPQNGQDYGNNRRGYDPFALLWWSLPQAKPPKERVTHRICYLIDGKWICQ